MQTGVGLRWFVEVLPELHNIRTQCKMCVVKTQFFKGSVPVFFFQTMKKGVHNFKLLVVSKLLP